MRPYHTIFWCNRQAKKKDGGFMPPPKLLLAEGLAVGTLIHSGILLVSTHQDSIQGAVVFRIAVISTLLNGAFDALVCLAVHNISSFLLGSDIVCPSG